MSRQNFVMYLIFNFIIDVAVWFQGDYWITNSKDPKADVGYILIPCAWVAICFITWAVADYYLNIKPKR